MLIHLLVTVKHQKWRVKCRRAQICFYNHFVGVTWILGRCAPSGPLSYEHRVAGLFSKEFQCCHLCQPSKV